MRQCHTQVGPFQLVVTRLVAGHRRVGRELNLSRKRLYFHLACFSALESCSEERHTVRKSKISKIRAVTMSSTTPIRPDMVKRAVIFLRHPKVKGAPQEKQMAFLKDKSLTQPEIEEALKKAADLAAAETARLLAPVLPPTKHLRKGSVRSEAVVSGGMVFVSGQTASPPPKGNGVAKIGNAEEQAADALQRVRSLLEEAGSSPAKVVSAMVCVRNLGEDLEGVEKAWGRWVDKNNPPARTVVQSEVFDGSAARAQGDNGLRVAVQVIARL